MRKRQVWTSGLVFFGLILMGGFQNCAPGNSSALTAEVDGELRIIDRWQLEKVVFPASTYYVEPNVNSVNIEGFCSQADGVDQVDWYTLRRALGQTGEVIGSGHAGCVNGSFSVALTSVDESLGSCFEELLLEAQTAEGDLARTLIKRRCF